MDQHSERDQERGETPPAKREYEPPDIQSQRVFETTALACGKLPGQGAKCIGAPKVS